MLEHYTDISSARFCICTEYKNVGDHEYEECLQEASSFADDTAQWAFSLQVRFAAKLLEQDLLKLAMWCAKWRIKLNPEKTKVIIFSRSILARKTELNLKLYGETLKIYPEVKFLGITFDSQLKLKKHFEDILDRCNTRYHRLRLLANQKWGPRPSTLIQI